MAFRLEVATKNDLLGCDHWIIIQALFCPEAKLEREGISTASLLYFAIWSHVLLRLKIVNMFVCFILLWYKLTERNYIQDN